MPPPAPAAFVDRKVDPEHRHRDEPWADAIVSLPAQAEDPDNAGIRREPELPQHEEVVPDPPKPVQEFELDDDDAQDVSADLRILQRRTRALARQVTLDPGDGMEL